ncbi:MAG: YceI family protein [Planctomycetaceae bacterium]|nr:YceI family protein [Planctomycetaceae bacterium]
MQTTSKMDQGTVTVTQPESARHRRTTGKLLPATLSSAAAVCIVLAFAAGEVLSSPAAQPGQDRATTTPAPAGQTAITPGAIDLSHSRVYVFVGKTGFGHDHGVEGKIKSGSLKLGATANAGQIVFDMTSFDADTNAARRYVGLSGSTDANTRQQVNTNMKGNAVLNVQRYPTATFNVASATPLNRKSRRGLPLYELTGQFTLHGVTRPLKIQADVEDKDGLQHVRGSFAIQQTHFGITPFSKAFGAVGVTDQLTIHGDVMVAPE